MLVIRLAWRNLFRNARRTALTLLLIGSSLAAMIVADGGIVGMTRMMADAVTETLMGDVQIHHPGFLESYDSDLMLAEGEELLARVRVLDSVAAAAPRVMSAGMVSSPYNLSGAQVFGIDHELEPAASKVDEALIRGEYLSGQRGEVLIGIELQRQLEVDLGDRLVVTLAEVETGELAQALFRVSGILEFGMQEFDAAALIVNIDQLQNVLGMENRLHQIVVQLNDRATAEDPASPIFRLVEKDIEVISWLDANAEMAAILAMTDYSSLIVGVILFVLASLGVINSMFMSIFERMYELGVIKALGTKPAQIVILVITEAGLIAMLSCIIGVILGGGLGYYFSVDGIPLGDLNLQGVSISKMKTVLLTRHFTLFPLLVIGLTIIASLYPARFAATLMPAQALKRTL